MNRILSLQMMGARAGNSIVEKNDIDSTCSGECCSCQDTCINTTSPGI